MRLEYICVLCDIHCCCLDLGFQAAQRVMSSSPQLALKVIKDTAQNIPMQAKSLYRIQVSKDLRKEITANHRVPVCVITISSITIPIQSSL